MRLYEQENSRRDVFDFLLSMLCLPVQVLSTHTYSNTFIELPFSLHSRYEYICIDFTFDISLRENRCSNFSLGKHFLKQTFPFLSECIQPFCVCFFHCVCVCVCVCLIEMC